MGHGRRDGDNIVWGTASDDDNIVWGTAGDDDNIVWGTAGDDDNIVWGTDCGGADCDNIVWGTADDDNIVWGTADDGDNIVWGTAGEDNIVWGTARATTDVTWGSSGEDERHVSPTTATEPLPDGITDLESRATSSSRSPSGTNQPKEASNGKDALPDEPGHDADDIQASLGVLEPRPASISSDWRDGLPVMSGKRVTLRELRASDAPSLFAMLTTEEVSRFISPPPATVEGFERFIAWTLRQRQAGTYACFAVTLEGSDTAIGIFQLRELEAGFGTAEWGFAIGSSYLGNRRVPERSGTRDQLCVRNGGRSPARGARGGPQRSRKRGAQESGRRAGRAASQVFLEERRVSRPGSLDHSR